MNQTKTHSQSIFVLTLAVYLGLVLAGGASPALAQAAMAKGFDLQVEQEYKDDLDKKPDSDEEYKKNAEELSDFVQMNEWFIEDLLELAASNGFDLDSDHFSLSQSRLLPCGDSKTGGYEFAAAEDRDIRNQQLAEHIRLRLARFEGFERIADCLPVQYHDWKNTSGVGYELSYDGSFLRIKASIKRQDQQSAAQLFESLQQAYRSELPDEEDRLETVVFENTKLFTENDQVFVVTNLPRAGLDALLAAGKQQ